jgi:hypothetical protein
MAGVAGFGFELTPDEWTIAFGASKSPTFFAVLFLRGGIAAYFVSVLSWSWAQCNECKWWIYLTDWAFFVETIYAVLLVVLTFHHTIWPRSSEKPPLRLLHSTFLVSFMIAVPMSVLVTVLFWTLMLPFWKLCALQIQVDGCLALPDKLMFAEHLFNTVLIMLSFVSCRVPFHFKNAGWPILFGTCYALWTVIYFYMSPNTPIYNVLDWRNPEDTLGKMTMTLVVVMPATLALAWFTGRTRDAFFSICCLLRCRCNDLPASSITSDCPKIVQSNTAERVV